MDMSPHPIQTCLQTSSSIAGPRAALLQASVKLSQTPPTGLTSGVIFQPRPPWQQFTSWS